MFGTLGYEGASMERIAKASGVTAAALYYHFANKRELLAEAMARLAQLVVEAVYVEPAAIAADPRAMLERFVSNYIVFQMTKIRSAAPMYSSLVHGVKQKRSVLTAKQLQHIRNIERGSLETLRSILAAGTERGEFSIESPTVTAFAILGMCEHTLSWVNPQGRSDVHEIARQHADLALRMTATECAKSLRR